MISKRVSRLTVKGMFLMTKAVGMISSSIGLAIPPMDADICIDWGGCSVLCGGDVPPELKSLVCGGENERSSCVTLCSSHACHIKRKKN
jgi:hypothetical protein